MFECTWCEGHERISDAEALSMGECNRGFDPAGPIQPSTRWMAYRVIRGTGDITATATGTTGKTISRLCTVQNYSNQAVKRQRINYCLCETKKNY